MLARPRRWWSGLDNPGRRELLIAGLLLLAYGYFQQVPAWNEYSRYDLTRAIVEQGTLRIDSFHENTGDKALYDGHWYSDKAPGTSLLGVPVYVLLLLASWLAGGGVPSQVEAVQALAFAVSAIPTALVVILLLRFLRPQVGERWAIVVALGYGLGSMAFPFATMFFGHAAATAALFVSFYLLHRLKSVPGRWTAVLAGLIAGVGVLIEIPVVLGVGVLGVYALSIGRGVALRFVAGGLPVALVFMAYNWLAFGGPFTLGYSYLLPGQFAEGMGAGIMGVTWPTLDKLEEILISGRGLLTLAPWLALAPVGVVAALRRSVRPEVLVCATVVVLFLAYNAGYYLPFGGWTPGPRFLMPALPFAAALVALAPAITRFVAVPLIAAAVAVFFVATATMPNAPERFADPLLQLWLPRFLAGELAETGAWLRWGVPGFAALAVLLGGLGLGALALVLSFGTTAVAGRAASRAPILVGILVLVFSVPFPPFGPVGVASGATGPPQLSVVELRHARIVVRGNEELELWARIENRGGPIASSRAHFSVWRESGEGVWSAWYGDVAIEAGARRTIRMTWRPDDAPPGEYRFGFLIDDQASGTVYVRVEAAEMATVRG